MTMTINELKNRLSRGSSLNSFQRFSSSRERSRSSSPRGSSDLSVSPSEYMYVEPSHLFSGIVPPDLIHGADRK